MGPIPLKGGRGTLTAEDRAEIMQATGVSASVRWRQQWKERCLSLSGPAENLSAAKKMADQAIAKNGDGGRDDGVEGGLEALKTENQELKQKVLMMEGTVAQMNQYCTALEGRMRQAELCATGAVQMAQATKNYMDEWVSREKKKKKHKKHHTASPPPLERRGQQDDGEDTEPQHPPKAKQETAKTGKSQGTTPENEKIPKAERSFGIPVKQEAAPSPSGGAAGGEVKAPISPTSDANRTVIPSADFEVDDGMSEPTLSPSEGAKKEIEKK